MSYYDAWDAATAATANATKEGTAHAHDAAARAWEATRKAARAAGLRDGGTGEEEARKNAAAHRSSAAALR